jgi:hypothetical protein
MAGIAFLATTWPAPIRGEGEKTRPWRLEFRILANQRDEEKAIEAARHYFVEAKEDTSRKAELERRARAGEPPPSMKLRTDKAPGYSWVEIGPIELRTLGLDNAVENDETRNAHWKRAAGAREQGEALVLDSGLLPLKWLLYSRKCQNSRLPKEAREMKRYEYFLLTRDPEKGKALTGEYLTRVKSGTDPDDFPFIAIDLTKKGGELFFELTTKNRSSGEEDKRHLAIIIDGQIITAPGINDPLREHAEFTGNFKPDQVKAIVDALRKDLLAATKK